MTEIYRSCNQQRIVEMMYRHTAHFRVFFIEDKDIVQSMVLKTFMDQIKSLTGFEPADEIVFNGEGDGTRWFNIFKIGPKMELNDFAELMGIAVSNVYGINYAEAYGVKCLAPDVEIKVTRKYD